MNILELFCGSKSFSNVAEKRGHTTFTSDIEPEFKPDYCVDILDFQTHKVPFKPDIIWASPPCQVFSIASVSRYWDKDRLPKNTKARHGLLMVAEALSIITELGPDYWFIENPRGMLRKLIHNTFLIYEIEEYVRRTVTYCQYGDKRMKPTDIWTNCESWIPRPMCKNGDRCHESAPRGSKTGTQGLKNAYERGKVPVELCKEILVQLEALQNI